MSPISDALKKARDYAEAEGASVQGGEKAAFHVCSPVGWINDPNGFSLYQGKVHLFFQHHPYSSEWGPMHWGHVITEDFVRWKLLPEAMAPDQPYETGCFSGSAVTISGKHALIYTSHLEQQDNLHPTLEQQSLAIGDGMNYEKVSCNPVLPSGNLPDATYTNDFRDPHVWKENGLYKMIVANRHPDGFGQYLIYRSSDLIRWQFVTSLGHSDGTLGRMWECPDYFPLDDHQVLLLSAQEMPANRTRGFHGQNDTAVLVGDRAAADERFTPASIRPVDYGWDFYAPQTMRTADGRRIMIAWMQSWNNNITPVSQSWTGMMTFPRELHVRSGCLYQLPVREIERFYTNFQHIKGKTDDGRHQLASGRQLDFTLTVDGAPDAVFSLDVAASGQYFTRLTFDGPAHCLTIDRSHAGMPGDKYPIQVIPLVSMPPKEKLRGLMDKFSLELFLNDGEQAVSVLLFTPQDCSDIAISAPKPVSYCLDCYTIDVV